MNYFTNGFNTLTQGVDVVATYSQSLGAGRLGATLAYNYNYSSVNKFDPGVISPAQIVDINHLAPNHRATLSANYTNGAWTLNARENFYSNWRNEVDYPGQQFGSKFTTDLDVSYTFHNHYTLTLGGQNIFDTKPDRIAQSANNPVFPVTGGGRDGQIYPRNGGPFGFNGGYWYARVRIKY